MIYDCFAFFNELELLDIRLNELDKVVDKFVLVEATRTFQNNPKPLYFKENKSSFEKFNDRIIHIVIDHFPGFFAKFRSPTPWDLDNYQKEGMLQGLKKCQPDDQIIVSDVDEIPKASSVKAYCDDPGIKVFEQRYYNYYFNFICTGFEGTKPSSTAVVNKNGLGYWRGSVMLPYHRIKTIKATRLKRDREEGVVVVEGGGWHFSHLGGAERVWKKLNAYTHPELLKQYSSIEKVEEAMLHGVGISTVKTHIQATDDQAELPAYILQHPATFKHLFYQQPGT